MAEESKIDDPELRVSFRYPFECDHTAIMDTKDNFSICYGCGQAVWKCKIDIKNRLKANGIDS